MNRDAGLRKLCDCARRTWAKCAHPWHFDYKWNGERYRFTLDRIVGRLRKDAKGKWRRDRGSLGDKITSKTAAEQEQERLRTAIREGTLQKAPDDKPQRDTLTLTALMAAYRKQHILVHRKGTIKTTDYVIGAIMRTMLERPDGERRAFGDWLVVDITTDVVEQYRRARGDKAGTGTNRHLELLRSLFNWATSSKRKLAAENPFADGTRAAVKLAPELSRRRRLHAGEGVRLLAACGPHLRAVVEAAIETGCRRGELLSLQWWQVRSEPKAELFLPAIKTKTKADRTVPISTRLGAILEMRLAVQLAELDEGAKLPTANYVFGNEVGEAIKSFKRAWQRALLVSHGHKPQYVVRTRGEGAEGVRVRTALLTPESQAALRAIDLHFHDLRREAGSRWLDAGVPLHRIQKWLGHANISQTSTYLMADSAEDDDAMRRFEERHAKLTRIDTRSETGEIEGAQSATMQDDTESLSSTKHH